MKERRQLLTATIASVLVIAYVMMVYWRCSGLPLNSDFANLVLEGKDLLAGNFFRKGWNLTGISFLTTDLPYFCIGVWLVGVGSQAYVIACVLMQLALTITAFLLIKDKLRGDFRIYKVGSVIAFAILLGLFSIDILRAHTGVFVIAFLVLYLYDFLLKRKCLNRRWSAALLFLLAAGAAGDPIILMMLVVPICLWAVIVWAKKQTDTATVCGFLGTSLFGAALGLLADGVYFRIGGANKNDFLNTKVFSNFDEIPEKITIYLRSLLLMSDSLFEGKEILSVQTLFYAVNVCLIMFFFGLLIYNLACFLKNRDYDFITLIAGCGFLLMSLLFVMTTISQSVASARYIGYFPFLMAIVYVRNMELLLRRMNERAVWIVGGVFLISLLGKIHNVWDLTGNARNEWIQISEVLAANHLKSGYASFWNASVATVASGEEICVRAIRYKGQSMEMFNWFCKDEWYQENAGFVIAQDHDPFGVTGTAVETAFGKPDRIIEVGNYQIYVYDENICKWLSNGLRDGILSPREWCANDKAHIEDDSYRMEEGAVLYGPYTKMEKGCYSATLYGENLNGISYDVFSNTIGVIKERDIIAGDNEFAFEFTLTDSIDDIEFRIFNNIQQDVKIFSLIIN